MEAEMIATQSDLIEWCREQREEAQKALALYESGQMSFHAGRVDVTPLQIANLTDIIANMDEIISRTPNA
jgi:hypothetical protein